MKTLALLGTVTGIALFAGIRLYATVLTVGLCLRYGLLHLPQELATLSVLSHPYVLGAQARPAYLPPPAERSHAPVISGFVATFQSPRGRYLLVGNNAPVGS